MKNLPQLVLSLGVIAGAAGSAAPSSLNASNSISILNGATQSKKKNKKRYWKKSLKSSEIYIYIRFQPTFRSIYTHHRSVHLFSPFLQDQC